MISGEGVGWSHPKGNCFFLSQGLSLYSVNYLVPSVTMLMTSPENSLETPWLRGRRLPSLPCSQNSARSLGAGLGSIADKDT